MEPADLRDRHHAPERWRLHLPWPGAVVVKRLMGPHRVVVGEVGAQEPAEMSLVQDEEVVEALAANRAESRSTKGFCQGERGAIRTSRILMRVTRWANTSS